MGWFLLLTSIFLIVPRCLVQAKFVLAHFMVENSRQYTVQDWTNQMDLASSHGIQGFALNFAAGDPSTTDALNLAFAAAKAQGMNLIFSFDYAGNGPWDRKDVMEYLLTYSSHPKYYQHNGLPLVSTFEGPANAEDWIEIKQAHPCFFIPDWSSVGAGPALELAGGVADGLFSWAAWPWGDRKMDTYTDASYIQALRGKPYMMAVSPWFYTNLPGFDKNWLWNGGNLWYERWQQIWQIQPEFVEIISWNDFGESHYIGPLDDRQYGAFDTGKAPFNYVEDSASDLHLDHTGWLIHLFFIIQTYLTGNGDITSESVLVSHKPTSSDVCTDDGGTTGNTASQLQLEFGPGQISQDRLYIAAMLKETADIYINDHIHVEAEYWDIIPTGEVGLYYHSVPMDGTGKQVITLKRGGQVVGTPLTTEVQADCFSNGKANWNARVETVLWDAGGLYHESVDVADRVCVKGWGPGEFADLCGWTCAYGYCPVGACVCEQIGLASRIPPSGSSDVGYPANGDDNFAGLCSFACNLGYCPPSSCSLTEQPKYIPSTSPFLPQTCISGSWNGVGNDYSGLCEYACNFGFCPMHKCKCTQQGALIQPPAIKRSDLSWKLWQDLNDSDLCWFACIRGYCPSPCDRYLDPDGGGQWDFSWVKSYAAVGDSFAAGIGIGTLMPGSEAYDCSRYDGAYPLKVQQELQAENFVFKACSGDTTKDIISKQLVDPLLSLDQKFDVITVSAGGNDVGFGDVLRACLFTIFSASGCEAALNATEEKIDNNLALSVVSVLNALNPRLRSRDSFIIWTLYAKFFDESPEPCNSLTWCALLVFCGTANVQLRQQFNRLVGKTNDVIRDTITQWNGGLQKAYPVEWSGFAIAMEGQFCQADSNNSVSDPSNDRLVFQRPDLVVVDGGDLRRRDSMRYGSRKADNVTEIEEWKREADAVAVPDSIARYFHPNLLGSMIQAELALGVIAIAWEDRNGETPDYQTCPIPASIHG